jgi:glyoxylase-like metal-dependent hydrolase (beta-lactamase superfamily II)
VKRSITVLFIVVVQLFGCSEKAASPMSVDGTPGEKTEPRFELYALRYGISTYPARAVFRGDTTGSSIPFHWYFYALVRGTDIALVDCGFDDPAIAKRFGVTLTEPTELLASIGVGPDDVTFVIVTHTHYDHIGTLDRYENAMVIIQKDELASFLAHPSAMKAARVLADRSRVIAFDREYELFGFVTVRKTGGHTIGSSVVSIATDGEPILLAGDEFYTRANIERGIPSGTTYDPAANERFLHELEASKARIYFFHDPGLIPDENENVLRIQ